MLSGKDGTKKASQKQSTHGKIIIQTLNSRDWETETELSLRMKVLEAVSIVYPTGYQIILKVLTFPTLYGKSRTSLYLKCIVLRQGSTGNSMQVCQYVRLLSVTQACVQFTSLTVLLGKIHIVGHGKLGLSTKESHVSSSTRQQLRSMDIHFQKNVLSFGKMWLQPQK